MCNFLAFLNGGLAVASDDAFADGQSLAHSCLEQLAAIDNPKQFPPRLLILLTSPTYLEMANAQNLLDGVHQAFYTSGHQDIPLIGSTVSAVFFNRQVHEEGALLICLASRMLEALVAVRPNARNEAEQVAEDLLNDLELNFTGQGHDPNPLVNRMLLTFLPGFGYPSTDQWYPAPDLHAALRQKVRARVPIIGGGSSAADPHRPGLQFANSDVYVDALVGVRLTTGFPFTSSIGHGLSSTGRIFRVKDLADDNRTIMELRDETIAEQETSLPADLLGLRDAPEATLGELSLDHDPVVNVAYPLANGAVRMLRNVAESNYFEKLVPEPGKMRAEAKDLVESSLRRLRIEHPAGCLGIHCSGRQDVSLTIGEMTDDLTEILQGAPYVGGFFDGEIGLGKTGRSLFGNWCVATATFGDEVRVRTPFYRGFEAIANYTPRLAEMLATVERNASVEQAIECSLDLIYQAGYPGAMIALILENNSKNWYVARQAIGRRYEKILKKAIGPFDENGLLARIAKGEISRLISDSQQFDDSELPGVSSSQLISQYIIPLKKWSGEIIGFLQIDLGDIRYKPCLQDTEQSVLDGLGAMIESNTVRLIVRKQTLIANELETALKESQAALTLHHALLHFLEQTLKTLGVDMGHIRLFRKEENALMMVAGSGAYYYALRQPRWKISLDEDSPSCTAFDCDKAIVVNDTMNDAWFQRLCERYQSETTISAALKQVGSFVNVTIEGENNKPLGTMNLMARQPWAFTRARMEALKVVTQRVGYLIGHLRRRQDREFLSQVSTNFVRNADFKEPLETVNEAVKRCCKAANAEIASLFLWDPEVKQFILRAQHGWANTDWVDAIRYAENERWTGRVAVAQQSQYLPDLYTYLESEGFPPKWNFTKHIFGEDSRPNYVIEALSLPLKLKERPLGVLILFRRIRAEQIGCDSGFTTNDPEVLQEAADNLATMVSAQLYYLRVLWQGDEMKRHRLVCEALVQRGKEQSLQDVLCTSIIHHFHNSRAILYLVKNDESNQVLEWAAGYRRSSSKIVTLPKQVPDELVNQAFSQKRIMEHYYHIPPEGWNDPQFAKSDGLVDRVCLPLRNGREVIGVLDLHWGTNRRRVRPMLAQHNRDLLITLGKEIGVNYHQQTEIAEKERSRRKAERSQLAVQTMGVMQFQSAHRLLNLTQDLRAISNLLTKVTDQSILQQRIEQLSKLIDSATKRVKRPMEVGRQIKNIKPQMYRLHYLLEQVLHESDIESKISVKITLDAVPLSLHVWVDQDLVREAFRNVIHNALKAMPSGGNLKIKASVGKDRQVAHIVFEDNGVGMSKEEVKTALSGFVSTQSSTGLGVLVSLLLIRASNGNLKIRSQKGAGTRVFIHLPIVPTPVEPREETL